MSRILAAAWVSLVLVLSAGSAMAQAPFAPNSQVPPDIAATLRSFNLQQNPASALALYTPLQRNAPRDGVKRSQDIAYGDDPRQRLDVYEPAVRPATPAPVLIFVHGGAFTAGARHFAEYYFDNVGYYFARHGVVTLNADYRLAPQHQWPAGAEDVARMVAWARANATGYGGDPHRIVVMGYSAGATHAAEYALTAAIRPVERQSIAGVILVSGLYLPPYDDVLCAPGAPPRQPGANFPDYWGPDALCKGKAIADNLMQQRLPTMIVFAELDSVNTHVEASVLYRNLCRRYRACPLLMMLRDHDHLSEIDAINTPDESFSRPALNFIMAARPTVE